MCNQLLLGDRVEILEVNDRDWAKVRCEWDGYHGWCKLGQLTRVTRKDYGKAAKHIAYKHYNTISFERGELWVPMGADLFGIKLLYKKGSYKGKKLAVNELTLSRDSLLDFAMMYMNAPYLWGGRSIAGIDCSGLVQIAFKLCGVAVPRDAEQQAETGELVDFLQDAKKGDLAFFDNAEGKIVHVGILLDAHHILHATDTSGRVVIDKIDNGGIISVALRQRTHKLRMIRRLI